MDSSTAKFHIPLPHEIRWHGRGGQGAVTGSKLLAEIALDMGLYIQSFPQFGSERRGAPIVAYSRLSKEPISVYTTITEPNIVVVLDSSLFNSVPVTQGLQVKGLLLVNTPDSPEEIRKNIDLEYVSIATVHATAIAMEHLGRPITNTSMLGALAGATNFQEIDDIAGHVRKKFSREYTPEIVDGNLAALRESYKSVQLEQAASAG